MSATEYVEGLNDLVAIATADLTASSAAYEEIEEPTMADWAAFVDREIAARRAFGDGFAALDPPDVIVDVHRILGDALDRGLVSTERLETITDDVTSPQEAQQTPEFAEYEAANADGSGRVCREAQARLDEIAASGETLANAPWLADLGLTVRATFGCLGTDAG